MPTNETKPWYRSVTIISTMLTAIWTMFAISGNPLDVISSAEISEQIVNLVESGITLFGSGVAIWGRLRAKTVIGGGA